jgi:hypothetical protein
MDIRNYEGRRSSGYGLFMLVLVAYVAIKYMINPDPATMRAIGQGLLVIAGVGFLASMVLWQRLSRAYDYEPVVFLGQERLGSEARALLMSSGLSFIAMAALGVVASTYR